MSVPERLAEVVSEFGEVTGEDKLKLLLVDGQNNHKWATTSPILKDILEKSVKIGS